MRSKRERVNYSPFSLKELTDERKRERERPIYDETGPKMTATAQAHLQSLSLPHVQNNYPGNAPKTTEKRIFSEYSHTLPRLSQRVEHWLMWAHYYLCHVTSLSLSLVAHDIFGWVVFSFYHVKNIGIERTSRGAKIIIKLIFYRYILKSVLRPADVDNKPDLERELLLISSCAVFLEIAHLSSSDSAARLIYVVLMSTFWSTRGYVSFGAAPAPQTTQLGLGC